MTAELKAAARRAVDAHRDELIGLARQIYAMPEAGFKEVKTSQLVAEQLQRLGAPFQTGLAMTGLKIVLDAGRAGPTVAIIGELGLGVTMDGIVAKFIRYMGRSAHPAAAATTAWSTTIGSSSLRR